MLGFLASYRICPVLGSTWRAPAGAPAPRRPSIIHMKSRRTVGFGRPYNLHALRHLTATSVQRAARHLYLAQQLVTHPSRIKTRAYAHASDVESYEALRGDGVRARPGCFKILSSLSGNRSRGNALPHVQTRRACRIQVGAARLDNWIRRAYVAGRRAAGAAARAGRAGGNPPRARHTPRFIRMLVPPGLQLPYMEVDARLRRHDRDYRRPAVYRVPVLGARILVPGSPRPSQPSSREPPPPRLRHHLRLHRHP